MATKFQLVSKIFSRILSRRIRLFHQCSQVLENAGHLLRRTPMANWMYLMRNSFGDTNVISGTCSFKEEYNVDKNNVCNQLGRIKMPVSMTIEIQGDRIRLQRAQWKNQEAYISNYPGLLDEVNKYTWTYSGDKHPYLRCATLQISLHEFALQFLYGKENLDKMLAKSNIIEHLDNNGLNCT